MKNSRITLTTTLVLALLVIFGCAHEADEAPVTIDNRTTERMTYTSNLSIGDRTFIKETKVQFTISAEGEVLSSEVLSRTLDGVEMERVGDGNWSVSVVIASDEAARNNSQPNLGGTVSESEDCNTEYTLIGIIYNPIPLGPNLCVYSTETTCYVTGYDSNGVLTTIITVEDGTEFAVCSPI